MFSRNASEIHSASYVTVSGRVLLPRLGAKVKLEAGENNNKPSLYFYKLNT